MLLHTAIILVYTIFSPHGLASNQMQFNTLRECKNVEQILHAQYDHTPTKVLTHCFYTRPIKEEK